MMLFLLFIEPIFPFAIMSLTLQPYKQCMYKGNSLSNVYLGPSFHFVNTKINMKHYKLEKRETSSVFKTKGCPSRDVTFGTSFDKSMLSE